MSTTGVCIQGLSDSKPVLGLLYLSTPPSFSFHFLLVQKFISGHSTFKYRTEQSPLILERPKAQQLNWNKIIQTFTSLKVYKFHFIGLYFHKWLSCQCYFIFTEVRKIQRKEVWEQNNLQHIFVFSSWYCKESVEVSNVKRGSHLIPFFQKPCTWAQTLGHPGQLTACRFLLHNLSSASTSRSFPRGPSLQDQT